MFSKVNVRPDFQERERTITSEEINLYSSVRVPRIKDHGTGSLDIITSDILPERHFDKVKRALIKDGIYVFMWRPNGLNDNLLPTREACERFFSSMKTLLSRSPTTEEVYPFRFLYNSETLAHRYHPEIDPEIDRLISSDRPFHRHSDVYSGETSGRKLQINTLFTSALLYLKPCRDLVIYDAKGPMDLLIKEVQERDTLNNPTEAEALEAILKSRIPTNLYGEQPNIWSFFTLADKDRLVPHGARLQNFRGFNYDHRKEEERNVVESQLMLSNYIDQTARRVPITHFFNDLNCGFPVVITTRPHSRGIINESHALSQVDLELHLNVDEIGPAEKERLRKMTEKQAESIIPLHFFGKKSWLTNPIFFNDNNSYFFPGWRKYWSSAIF